MSARERVGSLGGKTVRLARWVDTPYMPSWRQAFPDRQDIPGAEGKVASEPYVRLWHIDDWSGGEGERRWLGDGSYNTSVYVRPGSQGEGLVLTRQMQTTVNDADATFAEVRRFGIADGKLWCGKDDTVHEWEANNAGKWDTSGESVDVGGASQLIQGLADGGDSTHLYVSKANSKITELIVGGADADYVTSGMAATGSGQLCTFDNVMYLLDDGKLYSLTTDGTPGALSTLTTELVDHSAHSLDETAVGHSTVNRLAVSDKGPVWWERLENGHTYIWEYNVATSTAVRVGKLPVDSSVPHSIYWALGFTFVAFTTRTHTDSFGDGFLWYQRGAQRGVVGPLRNGDREIIAGLVGDDLIIVDAPDVLAYNLSSGGLSHYGKINNTGSTDVLGAICWDADVFIATSATTCERLAYSTYDTDTAAYLDTGRYDLGFPGITKTLLDVTVVTEPLPANTSVALWYSADGGSFTQATGTHSTTSATEKTWTVSSSSSAVSGRDFEFRVYLTTTDSSVTPTVRSLTARATSAQVQEYVDLVVDVGTPEGTADSHSDLKLADLMSLKGSIVSFVDPWQTDPYEDAASYDVVIESMAIPESGNESEQTALLRLRKVGLT